MKRILSLLYIFLFWTLLGVISKVVFIIAYHSLFASPGFADYVNVVFYGLKLDLAIAGYLTILPALILAVMEWYRGKVMKWIWNIYFVITSLACSLAYISNLGLYGYWSFPLDNTSLLYLKTSPADALASLAVWQLIVFPILIILVTIAISCFFKRLYPYASTDMALSTKRRVMNSFLLVLFGAVMIIPIRGGFGTGTNHTGAVYFSSDMRLNHAAVNPVFSFVESVSHQQNLTTQYHFMNSDEAEKIEKSLTYTQLRQDSTQQKYNVIIIGLESFSKYIMTETGHVKGVTPNLDALTKEGIYFSDFYANSFRTDRALVSILSALPAQPTMSIMDMPRKSTTLPSIARSLGNNGYSTSFYYGGDTNFSNMRSYMIGTGFSRIISDKDFPSNLRTCKWGVPDEYVYTRLLNDIKSNKIKSPFYCALMTESSHEPFDVPYKSNISSPELNAFAYADKCLGDFVRELKKQQCWNNTILVIVPDHLGAYPLNPDNYQYERYALPLIITGGAIHKNERNTTIGSQIDIAATILGMLGINHDDFIYSKDLLDPQAPHYAFFTFPDAMGMITTTSRVIYDNKTHSVAKQEGPEAEQLTKQSQAMLQSLYEYIDKR